MTGVCSSSGGQQEATESWSGRKSFLWLSTDAGQHLAQYPGRWGPFSLTGGPVQTRQAQQTTTFLPFPSLRQGWVLLCSLMAAEDQGRGRLTEHTSGSSPLWGRRMSQKGNLRL